MRPKTETVPKAVYDDLFTLVKDRYDEIVRVISDLRNETAATKAVLADVLGALEQTGPVVHGTLHMSEEEEDLRHKRATGQIGQDEFHSQLRELGIEALEFAG